MEDLPNWLDELTSEDEELIRDPVPSDDFMSDLRIEMTEEGAALAVEAEKPSGTGIEFLDTLLPWQRFTLATLLFLDVAVIGILFLTVLGRFSFS
ncbi:MAG: hypothetical protein JW981_06315 [Anaerolineae bacterium]|nr:hypothetical protein [Anaerolineae bacterium]